MKNNATRTIRSEEITIDVRICAALAANRGGEVYLAAIAPDMELTVITLDEAPGTVSANTVIYPGEAGAKGRDVYSTLILGANAYGTTEITGGGLEHFVKQLGSAGSADPLDQRSSTGWKATKVTEILHPDYLIRVECCSARKSKTAEAN